MLNKFIILSLLTGFLSTASADDGKFTFVQIEQPSPFAGTLFDPAATARMLAQNKFLRDEYSLKLAYELTTQEWAYKLELDQMQITLDIEKSKYESTLSLKDKEIEQLNKIIDKKPGSNAVAWGIVGGLIAGAGAAAAITKAASK